MAIKADLRIQKENINTEDTSIAIHDFGAFCISQFLIQRKKQQRDRSQTLFGNLLDQIFREIIYDVISLFPFLPN